MNKKTRKALKTDKVIDITITGKKSGKPHRIEIWFHNIDDRIYITGSPGTRDWYANIFVNPELIFHLKESAEVDLSAKAIPITKKQDRQTFFSKLVKINTYFGTDVVPLVAGSPLIEVIFI